MEVSARLLSGFRRRIRKKAIFNANQIPMPMQTASSIRSPPNLSFELHRNRCSPVVRRDIAGIHTFFELLILDRFFCIAAAAS
jgi:hypothetical protein